MYPITLEMADAIVPKEYGCKKLLEKQPVIIAIIVVKIVILRDLLTIVSASKPENAVFTGHFA